MEKLGKLFGSNARVKIMRLFLFNESQAFGVDDIVEKSIIQKSDVKRELQLLTKIGFLKKKTFVKKTILKSGKIKKKTVKGWVLNPKFDFIEPLRTLIESELIDEKEFLKKLKKAGALKFVTLSGLFLKDEDRKIDILIVGNNIKKNVLSHEIRKLEAEIGQELSYAVFGVDEFQYRLDMNDKLVRDVMENKNYVLLDKLSS